MLCLFWEAIHERNNIALHKQPSRIQLFYVRMWLDWHGFGGNKKKTKNKMCTWKSRIIRERNIHFSILGEGTTEIPTSSGQPQSPTEICEPLLTRNRKPMWTISHQQHLRRKKKGLLSRFCLILEKKSREKDEIIMKLFFLF